MTFHAEVEEAADKSAATVSWSEISDDIGLLKITMFPGAVGIDLARDIDRAIAGLRHRNRLIVDLRGNSGGGIGGLRLMSCF